MSALDSKNDPIEDLEYSKEGAKYHFSWGWREGVSGYKVRWRRLSSRGKFAWSSTKAKSNKITLDLQGPSEVEVYAEDIWGEKSQAPARVKVGGDE